jgi:hypothetical protein
MCPQGWIYKNIPNFVSPVHGDRYDVWHHRHYHRQFSNRYRFESQLKIVEYFLIIVFIILGGYPEECIDSSLVHDWSIKFFKRFACLKSKGRYDMNSMGELQHNSVSSAALDSGGSTGKFGQPTSASQVTLVTTVNGVCNYR